MPNEHNGAAFFRHIAETPKALVLEFRITHRQNFIDEQDVGVEMGGDSTESSASRVTEASIRGFWKAYRNAMGY